MRPDINPGGEGQTEARAANAAAPEKGASGSDRTASISHGEALGDAPRAKRRRRRKRRRKSDKPQSTTPVTQPKPAAPAVEQVYGALDLGTNNCRLLVARRTSDGFRVIDAYSRIVRLGEGLGASGQLSEAAMNRALDALAICADKMKRRGVTRARAIATQACRMASNGELFLERVKSRTGLTLEIIDAGDEARLALAGCAPLLDESCTSALVFDIGGGSTELISVRMEKDGGSRRSSIEDWISLPCGVVTLAERHGGVDVTPEIYRRMVDEISVMLQSFAERIGPKSSQSADGFHLLGTSGTVTTISGVHMGLERYNRNLVDGSWLSLQAVNEVTAKMLDMDYETRAAHSCIGRDRADLVLAGCAILEAITRIWPTERMRVADRGLREGMLLSLMQADSVTRTRGKRRRRRSKSSTHTRAA